MNVQHWLDDPEEESETGRYASIECPACTRLHLINQDTGKLVGEE